MHITVFINETNVEGLKALQTERATDPERDTMIEAENNRRIERENDIMTTIEYVYERTSELEMNRTMDRIE